MTQETDVQTEKLQDNNQESINKEAKMYWSMKDIQREKDKIILFQTTIRVQYSTMTLYCAPKIVINTEYRCT